MRCVYNFLKQLHSDENTNRPTSPYLQRCIRVFKQEKNRKTFKPTAQIARTKSYSANTELVCRMDRVNHGRLYRDAIWQFIVLAEMHWIFLKAHDAISCNDLSSTSRHLIWTEGPSQESDKTSEAGYYGLVRTIPLRRWPRKKQALTASAILFSISAVAQR